MLLVEAEGSGHAAASGRGRLEIYPQPVEKRFLGGHPHDRLVMAVAVEERFAVQLGQGRIGAELLFEKFAEQECLLTQSLRTGIVGKEVDEFVAEDGNTAGFEPDDRDSSFDLRLKLVENFEKQSLGTIKHAEIVERASAAEVGVWDQDTKAGGLEDLDGGFRRGRKEIVVECVGP